MNEVSGEATNEGESRIGAVRPARRGDRAGIDAGRVQIDVSGRESLNVSGSSGSTERERWRKPQNELSVTKK